MSLLVERSSVLVFWAEESRVLQSSTLEWSFGDSGVGPTGIPILGDWEVYGMTFQAVTFTSGRKIQIGLLQNGRVVEKIESDQNVKLTIFSKPVLFPHGSILGFETLSVVPASGVSNCRVSAWCRKV